MEKELIYNTKSKRYLEVGGQRYNKLLSNGYSIINNQLVLQKPLIDDNMNEIYKYIYDIDTLISLCNVNKKSNQLCSTQQFWIPILINHHIDLPQKNFESSKQWINYFYINDRINKMISKASGTNNVNIINKPFIKTSSHNIFDILNKYKLKKYNLDIMNKQSKEQLYIINPPQNNNWYIDFYYSEGSLTYQTNLKTVKMVLYDLINQNYI